RLGGPRALGEQGRDRAVPRRTDRPARRRALHPEALPAVPRLLRRLQHGAAADRGGADRDHPQVQEDPPVKYVRKREDAIARAPVGMSELVGGLVGGAAPPPPNQNKPFRGLS